MKFVENNLNWIHSANHPSCEKVRYAELAFNILREGNSVRFSTKLPELLGNEEYRILQPKTRVFSTGGTSGEPKSVFHGEDSLASAVRMLIDRVGEEPYNTFCCLPLNHVSGWMQVERAIRSKGTVLFGNYRDLLDKEFRKLIQKCWISLVPTQFELLSKSTNALSNLRESRGVLIGGSRLSSKLEEIAQNEDIPLNPCYGMSETAGLITLLESHNFLNRKRGVGECLKNVKIKIVENQIQLRSPSLCYGVDGNRCKNNTWFKTNDLGKYIPGTGYNIMGRIDRCIITGGEKVFPELVERLITEYPSVDQCFLHGEEDSFWGQKVVVYLVMNQVSKLKHIQKETKKKLLSYEFPKEWRVVDQLPLCDLGKKKI